MPTVLKTGPYRVYFYSHEATEPPHVHVDRDHQTAKFWLEPVALARNLGYSARDLGKIERLVTEHKDVFLDSWNEYFGH